MSSPSDRPHDPDDVSQYAPRWARETRNAERRPRWDEPSPPAGNLAPEAAPSLQPTDQALVIDRIRVPRSLDPGHIPEPPKTVRARSPLGLWARLAMLLVGAAGAAFFVVGGKISDGWPPSPGGPNAKQDTPFSSRFAGQVAKPAERAVQSATIQLVAQAMPPRPQGEAQRLGLSLPSSAGNDTAIVIGGLPAGTTLSAGYPYGAGGWRVPAAEMKEVQVYPPRGYLGGMDLAVELRQPNDSVADRRMLRLEWTPPAATPKPVETPVAAVALPQTAPISPPARLLDAEEIDALLRRGEDYLGSGDMVAARIAFKRAAEARDARAAFALASTYDPMVLERLHVVGFKPDINQARAWYEKAREFGSAEAPRRLEMLASRDR